MPEAGAEGVIIAQGGSIGGWSLYAKDGRLKYCYNLFGLKPFFVEAHASRSRRASTRCGWSSPTTAAAWARAARSRSTSTARRSARAASSAPCRWSSPPTRRATSARRAARRSSPDYGPRGNAFTGKVNWVQIDLDEAAGTPTTSSAAEERFRVAMAIQ